MNVYQLGQPGYASEHLALQFNPVQALREYWLPGMICPRCGAWASTRRPYLAIADQSLQAQLQQRFPISRERWLTLAKSVRQHLNVPNDFMLLPGDVLGTPRVNLVGPVVADVMHVFPGHIVVSAPVVAALENARVTGIQAMQLQVSFANELLANEFKHVALYELRFTGRIQLPESQPKEICSVCGRIARPSTSWYLSEPVRWDGSDAFLFDDNPNLALVTDKVRSILVEKNFQNFLCDKVNINLLQSDSFLH